MTESETSEESRPPYAHRLPAGVRLMSVAVVVVLVAFAGLAVNHYLSLQPATGSPAGVPLTGPGRLESMAASPGRPGPGGDPQRHTLVLYADGGPTPKLGHQYAIQAANLASRGGSWTLRPTDRYRRGELSRYQVAIYVGVDDRPIPSALLDDIAHSGVPVLWMGAGISQLFQADGSLVKRLGWRPNENDAVGDVTGVRYRGRLLQRQAKGNDALVRITVTNDQNAHVLGRGVRAGGSTLPWAVRSGDLTYIGEIPFSFEEPGDRYLALCDIIIRLVAPGAPNRHRALIRIEDVGPNTNPADIRNIADFLHSRGVPFSLAVYPFYRDPHGAANHGRPTEFRLVDKPKMVQALMYATQHGGTILMHGYTHQYGDKRNPYTATSAEDFEFYQAHVNAENNVQLDGPVPGDSHDWAVERLSAGRGEFVRVGLPDPDIFEFPHYTASMTDYRAVDQMFGVRYDQGSYFDGLCPKGNCANQTAPAGEMFQQFFPYPVRDAYGSVVIPENLVNVSEAYNNNPARSASDVVGDAAAMTVVKDGVVSGFYHPYLGVAKLAQIVDGIKALGYTYVSPYDVLK